MTAGFVVFGVGLPLYAWALRRVVPRPVWVAAAATGVATLAVAAAPLEHSATTDRWHGVFAGIGYATLAATPLLAARPLRVGTGGSSSRTACAADPAPRCLSRICSSDSKRAMPPGKLQIMVRRP